MNLRLPVIGIGLTLLVYGAHTAYEAYTDTGSELLALIGLIPVILGMIVIYVGWRLGSPTPTSNAQLGVGSVEKVTWTGLSVNDVPQYRLTLRVRGTDLQEFTGQLSLFIRPHELGTFAPGTIMPVAYEPEKAQRLMEVPDDRMEEAQQMYHRQRVLMGLADPRGPEIHARGTVTTGVIMSVTPTGEIRHGHTGIEIAVRFRDLGGNLVDRSKVTFLTPSMLSRLTVGRQIEVFHLPEDDTQFSFAVDTIDVGPAAE